MKLEALWAKARGRKGCQGINSAHTPRICGCMSLCVVLQWLSPHNLRFRCHSSLSARPPRTSACIPGRELFGVGDPSVTSSTGSLAGGGPFWENPWDQGAKASKLPALSGCHSDQSRSLKPKGPQIARLTNFGTLTSGRLSLTSMRPGFPRIWD